jgi:hypothetical protein
MGDPESGLRIPPQTGGSGSPCANLTSAPRAATAPPRRKGLQGRSTPPHTRRAISPRTLAHFFDLR